MKTGSALLESELVKILLLTASLALVIFYYSSCQRIQLGNCRGNIRIALIAYAGVVSDHSAPSGIPVCKRQIQLAIT